jgi:hypothetical protein
MDDGGRAYRCFPRRVGQEASLRSPPPWPVQGQVPRSSNGAEAEGAPGLWVGRLGWARMRRLLPVLCVHPEAWLVLSIVCSLFS